MNFHSLSLSRESWHRSFAEKRLKAWQPILTPAFTIPLYIFSGLLFVLVGTVVVLAAGGAFEHTQDYTDIATDENGVGSFEFVVPQDIHPPVWLHYELHDFYQNHRRYVKSYDYDQLSQPGNWHREFEGSGSAGTHLQKCEPVVFDEHKRVVYPCGLVPRSIFNDSFVVVQRPAGAPDWEHVEVDDEAEAIAWPSDLKGRFSNVDPEVRASSSGRLPQDELNQWLLELFPPLECHQTNFSNGRPLVPVTVARREEQIHPDGAGDSRVTSMEVDCRGYTSYKPMCNFVRGGKPFKCAGDYTPVARRRWGIESGHFLVWMRVGGLPVFRKAWGKINKVLHKGTVLKVFFVGNFPAKKYQGRKVLVIATPGSIGGAADLLGYAFLATGAACILFGFWKLLQCCYAPRQLGDVSFLAPHLHGGG